MVNIIPISDFKSSKAKVAWVQNKNIYQNIIGFCSEGKFYIYFKSEMDIS